MPKLVVALGVIELVSGVAVMIWTIIWGVSVAGAPGSRTGSDEFIHALRQGVWPLGGIVLMSLGLAGAVNLFRGEPLGPRITLVWAAALLSAYAAAAVFALLQVPGWAGATGSYAEGLNRVAKKISDDAAPFSPATNALRTLLVGVPLLVLPANVALALVRHRTVRSFFSSRSSGGR